MADDLAKAGMYALQGFILAMRDVGMVTDAVVAAIEQRSEMFVNYATVIESSSAADPDPDEARAIRHGMWWLRESVAGIQGYEAGPITDHPKFFHEWPKIEKLSSGDE